MPGDFDEFDIIERHAKEAAARKLEDALARNAAAQAQEQRDTAERKARSTELTLATNEMFRRAEYDRYGVEPPDGFPVSIGLLLRFGWTIVKLSSENRLVAPPTCERRRTRQDYINDQNT
jgi:hypothetical protein